MGIESSKWLDRVSNRIDLTAALTHLTRPNESDLKCMSDEEIDKKAIDNLIKILKDKKLLGSTTRTGFITGSDKAVCFQDVPLYSLIQNIEYEKRYRKENELSKIRYCGAGLQFYKTNVFQKGGRPVIYDDLGVAKAYLPENEWWRIVSLKLSTNDDIIDWTHEREWRVKGDFIFKPKSTRVLLYDKYSCEYFKNNCPKDIYDSIDGVVNLKAVLM